MAKRGMDENQQPTAQQALEKLSPGTRGGEREMKVKRFIGLVQVNHLLLQQLIQIPNFVTPSTTKQTISKLWRSKTCGDFP